MPETVTKKKIKRKLMAHFVNAALIGDAANYVRLGDDLEEYNVEMSASVNKRKNILGQTKVDIDSYEKSGSVTPYYAVQGDALHTRLQNILDEEQTLDDLKTTVLDVHLWESAGTDNTYVAYRENAVFEVASYGGDATGYQIPFNLHYTGERIKGTFNAKTNTFTEDTTSAASASATE